MFYQLFTVIQEQIYHSRLSLFRDCKALRSKNEENLVALQQAGSMETTARKNSSVLKWMLVATTITELRLIGHVLLLCQAGAKRRGVQ